MKKMTVKTAMKEIRIAIKSAERTFEDGMIYQGYKQDSIFKYQKEAYNILKNSKAKSSKIMIGRFLDKLTELEDKAFDQMQERIKNHKKLESNKVLAYNALKTSAIYIIEKLQKGNFRKECFSILYKHQITYLQYMPVSVKPGPDEIDIAIEKVEKLRNELVQLIQKTA